MGCLRLAIALIILLLISCRVIRGSPVEVKNAAVTTAPPEEFIYIHAIAVRLFVFVRYFILKTIFLFSTHIVILVGGIHLKITTRSGYTASSMLSTPVLAAIQIAHLFGRKYPFSNVGGVINILMFKRRCASSSV
jgi:hypothetical protein